MDHSFKNHAALVEEMAGKLGVNLGDELEAGNLTLNGLDHAVHRCMGCADPEGCALWMGEHPGGATTPPGICENRALFERLR